MTHRAYLLLGSNIAPRRHIAAALAALRAHGLVKVSPVYETAPEGTTRGGPFLNAAVALDTTLDPSALKRDVCAVIERRLGRERDPHDRNAPRTIDLDLVLWDTAAILVDGAPVPDPDILTRLHVARPLAELAPDLVHPTDGRTLLAIAADLDRATPPERRPRLVSDEG